MTKTWVALSAVLIAAAVVLNTALAPQQTEREHPLLDNLQAPPVNTPVQVPVFAREQVRPQLPDDGQPAVLVLQGNMPFRGSLTARGMVAVQPNALDFRPTSEEQEPIRILYRLPDRMEPLAQSNFEGAIEVREASGPAGSDRQLIVRGDNIIRFGEIWQSRPEPIDIALSPNVRIVQAASSQRQERGYTPVEVQVVDNRETVATLSIGEVNEVETSEGMLTIYPSTSQYLNTGDDQLAQYPSQYTLHVWIRGQ